MELTILKDIVIIFALSTVVNLLFTRLKIPTVIGYLFTGVLIGPYAFGLIGSHTNIELMAEIGVVLLMFTIGLEFSLQHLLKIRNIVFFGGLMQFLITSATFFAASFIYGTNWQTGLLFAFMASLSSSALVLKILQQRSELTSNYGHTVVGILIFQDLLLVPLILFTQLLGNNTGNITGQILMLGLKTIGIIGFVFIGNKWVVPFLLKRIAMAKSQELFLMSILLICAAVAMLTNELGMSVAFGAFLAGLMVSSSEYSHNAFGSLIPFKDLFTSFFFLSVGMLLDLNFVADNFLLVFGTVVLVLIIKTLIAALTGFALGHTFKGIIMVGLALSQVGEFSFILARIGLNFNIIDRFHYQLFLGVAILTMALSPFLIQWAKQLGNILSKLPIPDILRHGLFPLKEIEIPQLNNHLVIIGKDLSAIKLSVMAKHLKIPYISIIFDPMLVREHQKRGETVIYGDAANEPILHKACVDNADTVIISVGDVIASMSIIEHVRNLNPRAYIIVRAKQVADIEQLYKLGANHVLPEKFEVAANLLEITLEHKLLPKSYINKILGDIRNHHYGVCRDRLPKTKTSVLDDIPNLKISTFIVNQLSDVVGKTITGIKLRNTLKVTLLALKRGNKIIDHPGPDTVFESNDIVYILGDPAHVANAGNVFTAADKLFSKPA